MTTKTIAAAADKTVKEKSWLDKWGEEIEADKKARGWKTPVRKINDDGCSHVYLNPDRDGFCRCKKCGEIGMEIIE